MFIYKCVTFLSTCICVNTHYMRSLFIYTIIAVLLTLTTGCATTTSIPPVYSAAAADTATTAIVLHLGGHEINPFGFVGTTVLKGVYLFAYRPELDPEDRAQSDRTATALWAGAAANNLVQIVIPSAGLISIIVGVVVGLHLYKE